MSLYMSTKQMAYAGGDLNLANTPMRTKEWANPSFVADITIMRQCTKNNLYVTANSNAINRDVLGYKMPVWQVILIVVDCAVAISFGIWGLRI